MLLSIFILLAMGILAAISRQRKSSSRRMCLLGSFGLAQTKLDPKGTVLIQGELWRALSSNGEAIAQDSKIVVIGTSGHLLLVRFLDQ
jgi:membrane-bound serine protease (ClpP class)